MNKGVIMLKGLFKKKSVQLLPPMIGQIIPLKDVPDTVFSEKMIGDGFAILPKSGRVVAPVDCEVVQLFPTKHAIGLKTKTGLEILIHIGIDTVELKGEGFQAHIEVGDELEAGTLMLEVDLALLKDRGKSIVTPIVFTDKTTYRSFDVDYTGKAQYVCDIQL